MGGGGDWIEGIKGRRRRHKSEGMAMRRGENWRVEKERAGRRRAVREERH